MESAGTGSAGSGSPTSSSGASSASTVACRLTFTNVALANTPLEFRTGAYASAHTENPESPWYTTEGDAAGRSSDIGGGSSERGAIEGWMRAPFHAVGILRPELATTGFDMTPTGSAGLDVIRGLAPRGTREVAVTFPGDGVHNFIDEFWGELPDPREPCGSNYQTITGLPLIAMLPTDPGTNVRVELVQPDGAVLTQDSSDLCVVTAHNWHSTDPTYGESGGTILSVDSVVLLIPRLPLQAGEYHVRIDSDAPPLQWSFTQVERFLDVPDSEYFATPVRWLAANQISEGTDPGFFAPWDSVTRGQMALFLHRFAGDQRSAPTTGSPTCPQGRCIRPR